MRGVPAGAGGCGLAFVLQVSAVLAAWIRLHFGYAVLTHSVVSFVYNTAILGIAVGVITGK